MFNIPNVNPNKILQVAQFIGNNRIQTPPTTSVYTPASMVIETKRMDSILQTPVQLHTRTKKIIGEVKIGDVITEFYNQLKLCGLTPKRIDLAGSAVRYAIGPKEAEKFAKMHHIEFKNKQAFNAIRDVDFSIDMRGHPDACLARIPSILCAAVFKTATFYNAKYKNYDFLFNTLLLSYFSNADKKEKEAYNILSIGHPGLLWLDFSCSTRSGRKHIGSFDAMKIDLKPYLDGHGSLTWATDLKDPNLPMKHIIQNMVWVDEADDLNFMGFPRLALYCVKGIEMVNENDQPINFIEFLKPLAKKFVTFHRTNERRSIDYTLERIRKLHIGKEDLDTYERWLAFCLPFILSELKDGELKVILSNQFNQETDAGRFLEFLKQQYALGQINALRFDDFHCLMSLLELKPTIEPKKEIWLTFFPKVHRFETKLITNQNREGIRLNTLFPAGIRLKIVEHHNNKKITQEISLNEMIKMLLKGSSESEFPVLLSKLLQWQIKHDLESALITYFDHQEIISVELKKQLLEQAFESSENHFISYFAKLYNIIPMTERKKWIDKIIDTGIWKKNDFVLFIHSNREIFNQFVPIFSTKSCLDDFIEFSKSQLGLELKEGTEPSEKTGKWDQYKNLLNKVVENLVKNKEYSKIKDLLKNSSIRLLRDQLINILRDEFFMLYLENKRIEYLPNLIELTKASILIRGQEEYVFSHLGILINYCPESDLFLEASVQNLFKKKGQYAKLLKSMTDAFPDLSQDLRELWLISVCESKEADAAKLKWMNTGFDVFRTQQSPIGPQLQQSLIDYAENFDGALQLRFNLYNILSHFNLRISKIPNLQKLFKPDSMKLDEMNRLWTLINKVCNIDLNIHRDIIEQLVCVNADEKPDVAQNLVQENRSLWQKQEDLLSFVKKLPKGSRVREQCLSLLSEWDPGIWNEIQQTVCQKCPDLFQICLINPAEPSNKEFISQILNGANKDQIDVQMINHWHVMTKKQMASILANLIERSDIIQISDKIFRAFVKVSSKFESEFNPFLSLQLQEFVKHISKQSPETLVSALGCLENVCEQVEIGKRQELVWSWISCLRHHPLEIKAIDNQTLKKIVKFSTQLLIEHYDSFTMERFKSWLDLFKWISESQEEDRLEKTNGAIQNLISWISSFLENKEEAAVRAKQIKDFKSAAKTLEKSFAVGLGKDHPGSGLFSDVTKEIQTFSSKITKLQHEHSVEHLQDQLNVLDHLQKQLQSVLKMQPLDKGLFDKCDPGQINPVQLIEGHGLDKELIQKFKLKLKNYKIVFDVTKNIIHIKSILDGDQKKVFEKLLMTLSESLGTLQPESTSLFLTSCLTLSTAIVEFLKDKSSLVNFEFLSKEISIKLSIDELNYINNFENASINGNVEDIDRCIKKISRQSNIIKLASSFVKDHLEVCQTDEEIEKIIQVILMDSFNESIDYKCRFDEIDVVIDRELDNLKSNFDRLFDLNMQQLDKLISTLSALAHEHPILKAESNRSITFINASQGRIKNIKMEMKAKAKSYIRLGEDAKKVSDLIQDKCSYLDCVIKNTNKLIEMNVADNEIAILLKRLSKGLYDQSKFEEVVWVIVHERKIFVMNDQINHLYTKIEANPTLKDKCSAKMIYPSVRELKSELLKLEEESVMTREELENELSQINKKVELMHDTLDILDEEFKEILLSDPQFEALISKRIDGKITNSDFRSELITMREINLKKRLV